MTVTPLTGWLPPSDGYLPQWLLFVRGRASLLFPLFIFSLAIPAHCRCQQISVVSLGNTIQSYLSLGPTRQVYAATPQAVTPLSARTFGTWTALSALVRLYAAYHINEPAAYDLCLCTYGVAAWHFFSEWLVFGSAKWGRGLMGPVSVASLTAFWMWRVKEEYVVY